MPYVVVGFVPALYVNLPQPLPSMFGTTHSSSVQPNASRHLVCGLRRAVRGLHAAIDQVQGLPCAGVATPPCCRLHGAAVIKLIDRLHRAVFALVDPPSTNAGSTLLI